MGAGNARAPSKKGPETVDAEDPVETRGELTPSEGLARKLRLARADDFRRVLGRGKRHRTACLDIVWINNEVGHPRLGLVVPKFQSSAVARNRLRRRLKEVMRRFGLPRLESVDVVIRVRREAYGLGAGELVGEVQRWLTTKVSFES